MYICPTCLHVSEDEQDTCFKCLSVDRFLSIKDLIQGTAPSRNYTTDISKLIPIIISVGKKKKWLSSDNILLK